MTFLKLTDQASDKPVYLNMDRVERFGTGVEGTLLWYAGESCAANVKESPEEIMKMIAEAEQAHQFSPDFLERIASALESIGD